MNENLEIARIQKETESQTKTRVGVKSDLAKINTIQRQNNGKYAEMRQNEEEAVVIEEKIKKAREELKILRDERRKMFEKRDIIDGQLDQEKSKVGSGNNEIQNLETDIEKMEAELKEKKNQVVLIIQGFFREVDGYMSKYVIADEVEKRKAEIINELQPKKK